MSAFAAAASDEDGDTIRDLRRQVADLEAQLYAVGAGGVGSPVTAGHHAQLLNMVPSGWKLVPEEPIATMLNAWCEAETESSAHQHTSDVMRAGYRAMLAAAPKPPVTDQEPVAWQCRMRAKWGRSGEWWPWQECNQEKAEDYKRVPCLNDWEYEARPLYTHPQPIQPLTDEEIERNWQFLHDEEGNPPDQHDFARAIERAHGIGGEE